MKQFDPGEFVFLDEAGFSLSMTRLYGWSLRGQRLVEAVPAQRGKNLSVLGALDKEGLIVTRSKVGAMNRADIETFLRRDLLPRLLPGSVLVLDNASIHRGGKIEQIVRRAGCSLLYLSPYSPDFNPIELAWSYIKNAVRAVAPRDEGARLAAIQTAQQSLPAEHAVAWFRKCGYALP